jgi:hypothetical protein
MYVSTVYSTSHIMGAQSPMYEAASTANTNRKGMCAYAFWSRKKKTGERTKGITKEKEYEDNGRKRREG